jgi:hypothetical protein
MSNKAGTELSFFSCFPPLPIAQVTTSTPLHIDELELAFAHYRSLLGSIKQGVIFKNNNLFHKITSILFKQRINVNTATDYSGR